MFAKGGGGTPVADKICQTVFEKLPQDKLYKTVDNEPAKTWLGKKRKSKISYVGSIAHICHLRHHRRWCTYFKLVLYFAQSM